MFRILLILLLTAPMLLWAQYERPGSSDAQFLKIGVSPRAAALGESYISVVHGGEATYYNPASIALIEKMDLVFTHTRWFAGINHEFAAAVRNFQRYGSVGISVTALYTDEMEVTTPLQPNGSGETFYAGNYRFGLSYARHLTDRVTFGGSISYIHLSLYEDFKANALAGDIAVLYVSRFRGFRFGMKIANFGSEVKFVNESYPLPTNFQFGLSMNAIENDQQALLVSASALKPNDGKPLGSAGVEWNWNDTFFLRSGYHFNHDTQTYALGGGLKWSVASYQLRFDYSYSDFSLLGASHRFGVGFTFEN